MDRDHEHSHDDAHEAFPRRLIASMIAGASDRSLLRERIQALAIALGLALVALALPTTTLLLEGPELVEGSSHGAWISVHLALTPIARFLALLPRIQIEQAWFIVSALAWGASGVACWKMLARHGIATRAAVLAGLSVLASPVAWFSGTMPGPSAPGLLGAFLVFGRLLEATREPERRDLDRAIATTWGIAMLLDIRTVWLAPAILMQSAQAAKATKQGSARVFERGVALGRPVIAWLVAAAIAVTLLHSEPAGFAFFQRVLGTIVGRGLGFSGSLWLVVFGLGAAAFGFVALLMPPSQPEESRPPIWIAVWCAAPMLAPLVFGRVDWTSVAISLVPPAALGLASWFSDRDWIVLARHGSLLLAGQLAIGWGFNYGVKSRDANAIWSVQAAQTFEPKDLVLTDSRQHAYLVRHRFRLAVVDLNEPLSKDADAVQDWWLKLNTRVRKTGDDGGRVVFDLGDRASDYRYRTELDRLRFLAPNVDLKP